MATVNVLPNGNAPSGLQFGDNVRTAGGVYTVVPNGTPGSTYNASSGYSSIPANTDNIFTSAFGIQNMNNQQFEENVNRANNISADSSAKQYEYNALEAQKNRDFQKMMSDTAHQREVQDLLKAGLNPVLSATLGGSSTPSGATASGGSYQGQSAQVDTTLLSAIMSLYGTMINNETSKDIAKINAETNLQTAKISSAASMYSANQMAAASRYGSDLSFSSSNPMNRVINSVLSGNAGEVVSGLWNSIDNLGISKFANNVSDSRAKSVYK